VADVVLVVLDASRALDDDDRAILRETSSGPRVVVLNKSDMVHATGGDLPVTEPVVRIAAKSGEGIDTLRQQLVRALSGGEWLRDRVSVSNARHVELLREVRQALGRAGATSAQGEASEEFVLVDLQAARACLDEIVGRRTGEDVLRHIFEHFCIGK
jgi:tRNA modification GTPase